MSEPIRAAAFDLFDDPNYAVVATLMPDGSPQATVVWIERDGDRAVLFNTERGRSKPANLERDPRVAVTVIDHDNPYRYVQVRGRATLTEEGARAHIDALARKYTGKDYSKHREDRARVIVRVEPESIDYHG
ncbi:MAG TPA: PPOX class F420-dependent oxidoreductase [Egibacteraceae bacterium]|nr:PPOX class F420-dependent oxidoreductase [Egibacteraceae bacterium]